MKVRIWKSKSGNGWEVRVWIGADEVERVEATVPGTEYALDHSQARNVLRALTHAADQLPTEPVDRRSLLRKDRGDTDALPSSDKEAPDEPEDEAATA